MLLFINGFNTQNKPRAAGTGLGRAGIFDLEEGGTTAVGFEPEWIMDVHLSDWLLSRLCLAEFGESKVGKTAGSKVGVDLEWNDSALLGLEV